MDELIQRLVSGLGIDDGMAQQFLGAVLNLLKDNVDATQFEQLMGLIPGAAALLQGDADTSGGGLLGGLADSLGKSLGGDIGAAIDGLGAISDSGLNVDQFGQATEIFGSFIGEKGGGDLVSVVLDSLNAMK